MKKLNGIPVSSGIVIGKAYIHPENDLPEIKRYSIRKTQIDTEINRFKIAVAGAAEDVRALHKRATLEMGKDQADIFAAHLMMLEDEFFHDEIVNKIRESQENVEWVIYDSARSMVQKMRASPDPAFGERAVDISDISRRILERLLSIQKAFLAGIDRDIILVVHDLLPSDVLTMNRKYVKGILMNMGGTTSHTAILARAFNIPAVMGLSTATSEIKNEDTLVLNAAAGEVIVNPDEKVLEKWTRTENRFNKKMNKLSALRELPAETKDGYRVLIKANIEIPEEVEELRNFGAEGIGLYRSEFLFLNPGTTAEEDFQLNAYNQVLKTMGELPVTIRTVDMGGDKILPDYFSAAEKNPLLGWRAIRFSLAIPDLFKTQLRALLRSSVNGNVKIMFPMITGLEEMNDALSFLEEAKAECRKKKQPFSENIEVGTMIETPSAAITADILAKKADFFSIGTNDLIQYSLAVDRGNEKVSYLAQPAHPAILRLIKNTVDSAHAKGVKVAMCGEMAGDPGMAVLLLGLGLDELSMAASSIPQVKNIIRGVKHSDCRKLTEELLNGVSFMTNNALLKAWMTENFPKE